MAGVVGEQTFGLGDGNQAVVGTNERERRLAGVEQVLVKQTGKPGSPFPPFFDDNLRKRFTRSFAHPIGQPAAFFFGYRIRGRGASFRTRTRQTSGDQALDDFLNFVARLFLYYRFLRHNLEPHRLPLPQVEWLQWAQYAVFIHSRNNLCHRSPHFSRFTFRVLIIPQKVAWMKSIELADHQLALIKRPIESKIFLEGPAGAGKTTAGIGRLLHLLAADVPGETILMIVSLEH
jgi:hypothetical protein